MFGDGGKWGDANGHIERAKSHAVNGALQYELGRATRMQAEVWYGQLRLEDAKSEALHSLEIFERLGAMEDVMKAKSLLQKVEQAIEERSVRPRWASRTSTTSNHC